MAGGGNSLNIYIDGTLILSNEAGTTGNLFDITSTGFKKSSASSNAWTYSGNLEFLGFSLTQGATTAHDSLRVGYTIDAQSLYALNNYSSDLYLYSVEAIPDRAISLENLYEFKNKMSANYAPKLYVHYIYLLKGSLLSGTSYYFYILSTKKDKLTSKNGLASLLQFGVLLPNSRIGRNPVINIMVWSEIYCIDTSNSNAIVKESVYESSVVFKSDSVTEWKGY